MIKSLLYFINDEDGQGMTEYAFILSLVVVFSILAFTAFGITLRDYLNNSVNEIVKI